MTYETEARREFEEFPRFWVSECASLAEVLALPTPGEVIFVSWRVHLFSLPGALMMASLDTNRDHFPAPRDESLWSPLSTQNCLFSLDQWNNPNLSTTWQNILWARFGPMEMFIQSQSVVDINSVGISKSYSRYILNYNRNEHVIRMISTFQDVAEGRPRVYSLCVSSLTGISLRVSQSH